MKKGWFARLMVALFSPNCYVFGDEELEEVQKQNMWIGFLLCYRVHMAAGPMVLDINNPTVRKMLQTQFDHAYVELMKEAAKNNG